MKFQLSTKPLSDALALGVVNANVSRYYVRSCNVQLTATNRELTVNLEAAQVVTEIRLKGAGDCAEGESYTMFVDTLMFKQLINTLDSATITLEFADGGLIVHSGKSRFTLPQTADSDSGKFSAPDTSLENAISIPMDANAWKYIKDNQMYAISMAFIHPVYTRAWCGASGDVIVGDMDNSVFTHSCKGNLGDTCLLTDTVVNLLYSLPEGANLYNFGKKYQVHVNNDSFTLISEFTPEYESDVGDYQADMILNMMSHDEAYYAAVNPNDLKKFMSQAELLANSADSSITLEVTDSELILKNSSIDCRVPVKNNGLDPFTLDFNLKLLKSVLGTYSGEFMNLTSLVVGDEISGVVAWDDELTTVLAGLD